MRKRARIASRCVRSKALVIPFANQASRRVELTNFFFFSVSKENETREISRARDVIPDSSFLLLLLRLEHEENSLSNLSSLSRAVLPILDTIIGGSFRIS